MAKIVIMELTHLLDKRMLIQVAQKSHVQSVPYVFLNLNFKHCLSGCNICTVQSECFIDRKLKNTLFKFPKPPAQQIVWCFHFCQPVFYS